MSQNANKRANLHANSLKDHTAYTIDEDFKKHIDKKVRDNPLLQVAKVEYWLEASDTIDGRVTPLFSKCYEGSIVLEKTSLLLTEVIRGAERLAYTTQIDDAPKASNDGKCPICLEDLEAKIADTGWRSSHYAVITSCGHIFGSYCLSIWLSDPKRRSCPKCRKDFNQAVEDRNQTWQTWEDIRAWYTERKQTILECDHEHACIQWSGRYLWDGCSMEELQAQFDMQDYISVPLEHLVYIVLDVNINLRAADYLSTGNFNQYLDRTHIVLVGLFRHLSKENILDIRSRLVRLEEPGGYGEVGDWTAETRHEVCAELLNMLHGTMLLYEKQAKKVVHEEAEDQPCYLCKQKEKLSSIDLDRLQANCGKSDRCFTSSQSLLEFAQGYEEYSSRPGMPDRDSVLENLRWLGREQKAVLEAVSECIQRTSTFPDPRSMRAYLQDRICTLHHILRLFSKEFQRPGFRELGRKLEEQQSQIKKDFHLLVCLSCLQKAIQLDDHNKNLL